MRLITPENKAGGLNRSSDTGSGIEDGRETGLTAWVRSYISAVGCGSCVVLGLRGGRGTR